MAKDHHSKSLGFPCQLDIYLLILVRIQSQLDLYLFILVRVLFGQKQLASDGNRHHFLFLADTSPQVDALALNLMKILVGYPLKSIENALYFNTILPSLDTWTMNIANI